ncbi:MAG: hypothetical protein COB61_004230 [Thiotrichales bacterium]|nr:hypothetical protein [Thiotrichales bacterium]
MDTQQIAVQQYREHIVTPVLKWLGMYSESAVRLVMGTAATESHFDFIKQIGGGPALGRYQMEPATHDDIWDNYLRYKPALRDKILYGVGALFDQDVPRHRLLTGSDYYATAMCRLHYRRVKAALPDHDNIEQLANYWKQHYNTYKGKGSVNKFVDDYFRYVGENHAL